MVNLSDLPKVVTIENTSNSSIRILSRPGYSGGYLLPAGETIKLLAQDSQELISYLAQESVSSDLTIEVEGITSEEEASTLDSETIAAVIDYLGNFGHVRVLNDLDTTFNGSTVSGMTITNYQFSGNQVVLSLSLNDYGYDSVSQPRTVTGSATLTFNGYVNNDELVYYAESYRIDGNLTFNNGLKDGVVIKLTGVTGTFSGVLRIKISDDWQSFDIVDDDKTAGKFGTIASVTSATVNGVTIDITSILS